MFLFPLYFRGIIIFLNGGKESSEKIFNSCDYLSLI